MINIPCPIRDENNDIGNIVDEKNAGSTKAALTALLPRIRKRYATYAKIELNNRITKDNFTKAEKDALRNLYSSKTQTAKSIIECITTIQLLIQAGCCLSCGIGDPDEVDHFLPQEHFPEFSILHKNLVPICGTCNQIKGKNIPGGDRDYFHPMFDNLPNGQFLDCTITYLNSIPKAHFSINPLFNGSVIKRHFDNLNLSARLEKRARQYFLQINAIKNDTDNSYATQEIQRDKIKLGVLIGTLYWKYILCDTMLATSYVEQI